MLFNDDMNYFQLVHSVGMQLNEELTGISEEQGETLIFESLCMWVTSNSPLARYFMPSGLQYGS